PASACLMNPMICSVVKRLFFMSVLVVDGLYSFTRYGSAGAGHRHLGAIAHQQCGGQRGAHLLHYRVFSS
ncbi:hypothetical protein, partial [Xanthomonas campestris]|uniref:hypothetical protein n=1 Tax=Xanthomonas campestris TaxID=339 RepID=UPI0039C0E928